MGPLYLRGVIFEELQDLLFLAKNDLLPRSSALVAFIPLLDHLQIDHLQIFPAVLRALLFRRTASAS